MISLQLRYAYFALLAIVSSAVHACNSESVALFGCDAASSRKFIELCAPSPLDARSGDLHPSARPATIDAGVEVRDRNSGKTSIVSCSERPRFYIYELKGLVPCDPETPVGTACVK